MDLYLLGLEVDDNSIKSNSWSHVNLDSSQNYWVGPDSKATQLLGYAVNSVSFEGTLS